MSPKQFLPVRPPACMGQTLEDNNDHSDQKKKHEAVSYCNVFSNYFTEYISKTASFYVET